MLDDEELVPGPSRAAVRADLESLAGDFGRLFGTDCECHLRTDRHFWPSRFIDSDGDLPWLRSKDDIGHWERAINGVGLEVEPVPVRSAEDADRAPMFFDRAGRQVVNSVGQSLIVAPGWELTHEIQLRGPGSLRAAETIKRANDLAFNVAGLFASRLWPERSLRVRGFCWPDIVDAVADLANRSTLKTTEWFVTAGRQSYSLSVWRRRADFRLGGPIVAPEIAERIGDDPEHVWAERRAFLRDSETVARWLIEELAEPVGDDIEADDHGGDRNDIGSAALKAVIDGGLAGVLRLATGAKSADQISKIMRKRWEAEPELKEWPANRWVIELSCGKQTIIGNKRKGIPPCDAWAERMAWKESNKQARKRNSVS